ncbi:MAG: DUF4058 family protein [Fimbriimonadales bacterium]|nr:DUF4058 family protein [Fimbriimonadales bacterium]
MGRRSPQADYLHRKHLATTFAPRYFERVYVEQSLREIKPDVSLRRRLEPRMGDVAVLEATYDPPLVLQVEERLHTEGYIHILDRDHGMRLVTVIEVLSPTNKDPPFRRAHLVPAQAS